MTAGTGSTILVTGGSAFVGSQLARTLAARRYHVRVLTRVPERVQDLRSAGIEISEGSLGDRASLGRACEGVRLVYSTAGLAMRRGRGLAASTTVNVTGVGTLVDVASAMGVRRIVHCSTAGVHGHIGQGLANEDAPFDSQDVNDAVRLEGERVARREAGRVGIELVIVRPSTVYGPGDCRLLSLFRGIARRRFVLLGRGDGLVHLVYVDDLVEGLRLCGEASRAVDRTYILAGGEVVRFGDLVRLIAKEAGVRPWPFSLPVWPAQAAARLCETTCNFIGVTPPLAGHRLALYLEDRAFDISRARAELGFAPMVGLREGVRRCLEWYRGRDLI